MFPRIPLSSSPVYRQALVCLSTGAEVNKNGSREILTYRNAQNLALHRRVLLSPFVLCAIPFLLDNISLLSAPLFPNWQVALHVRHKWLNPWEWNNLNKFYSFRSNHKFKLISDNFLTIYKRVSFSIFWDRIIIVENIYQSVCELVSTSKNIKRICISHLFPTLR
jgi:hypothetical protein